MIRLLLVLGVGLYTILLAVGDDGGKPRAGLAGAYAINTALPAVAPKPVAAKRAGVSSAAAVPAPFTAVAVVMPAGAPVEAVYTPSQPVMQRPLEPTQGIVELLAQDIRRVTASSANVRSGPSTGDLVLDRLGAGEEVLIVADAGDGWVKIRIEGDGVEGYVAARLLSAPGN